MNVTKAELFNMILDITARLDALEGRRQAETRSGLFAELRRAAERGDKLGVHRCTERLAAFYQRGDGASSPDPGSSSPGVSKELRQG